MKPAASVLIWMCSVLVFSPAWSEPQAKETLAVLVAAPAYWCPYACADARSRSGFAVDIARAALESEGHSIDYQNLPFNRALVEAKSGRIDAIIPVFRGEAPDFVFTSHAVSLTEYCFYVSEDDPWRYNGRDSLENLRLVVTSGYSYGDDMDAFISERQEESVMLIRGDDIPNRLRELVRRDRYDAMLDDRLLFESSGKSVGLVNAGCLDERHAGYLALSPENPDRSSAIAEAFDRGIQTIRKDGQLCDILEKYGLGTEFVPGLNREECSFYAQ